MPGHVIKLTEGKRSWYLEWGSSVDAPVTYGMNRSAFERYWRDEYGRASMDDFEKFMKRVDLCGTSSVTHASVDVFVACNRAGPGETRLTVPQLIDRFCKKKPDFTIEYEDCARCGNKMTHGERDICHGCQSKGTGK